MAHLTPEAELSPTPPLAAVNILLTILFRLRCRGNQRAGDIGHKQLRRPDCWAAVPIVASGATTPTSRLADRHRTVELAAQRFTWNEEYHAEPKIS